MADSENFGGGGFEAKTSKIRMTSPKLRLIFRPKSEIQTFFSPKIRWSPKKKKKKKGLLRLIFRPDSLRLGRWGGDASRNGAELFKIRADFSAKIVTFRLVGGDASPPIPPPPKSATACRFYSSKREWVNLAGKSLKVNVFLVRSKMRFVFRWFLNVGVDSMIQGSSNS